MSSETNDRERKRNSKTSASTRSVARATNTGKTKINGQMVAQKGMSQSVTVADPEEDNLTPKQRAFVENYVETLNATESARRAGYCGTYDSLRSMGSRLLTNVNVAKCVKERLEQCRMSHLAIDARLSRIASGSLEPFLYRSDEAAEKGEPPHLDVNAPEGRANADLIKKIKTRTFEKITSEGTGDGSDESAIRVMEVELEIHNPLVALKILKDAHMKVEAHLPPPLPPSATSNNTSQVTTKSPEEAREELAQLLGMPLDRVPPTARQMLIGIEDKVRAIQEEL